MKLQIIQLLKMTPLALFGMVGISAAAETPASWAKSMTNDPATNVYLARVAKPLSTPDAESMRIVVLAKLLSRECRGASLNKKALKTFIANSGYTKIKGKAFDDAAFLVGHSFQYFDYRSLAHLCAGSDYLFGPNGHVAAGLMKPGKGRPKASYDPNILYLRVKLPKS